MGNWYTWVLAIVVGAGLGILMNRSKSTNKSAIHVISKKDFYDNMRKGQLIDIRKKDEFEADKIKGARNFKPNQITSKYTKIRKDQSVYMYCKNGKKSKRLANKMSRNGHTAIYILENGFEQK